ncbi:MAG: RelA/SpoT domain-containing protein [Saprospiraceae bacterium]|nr:RelA/SpoT domain-containing protein [Candidatus Vicinibacter affinis]
MGFPIQSRVKIFYSIKEKIDSGRFNIKQGISEFQDLIGVRIILLFLSDLERIFEIIENNFKVIKNYNTIDKLNYNQFGYSSIHYIVKVDETWRKVPSFRNLGDYYIEFQIRTLSQHIWAEASKSLQYKNEKDIPRELSRSIGRVSALLETVDLEFVRLLNERDNYKHQIKESSNIDKDDILNIDLLEEIIKEKIGTNRSGLSDQLHQIITELRMWKINTVKDFKDLLEAEYNKILSKEKEISKEIIETNSSEPTGPNYELLKQGIYFNSYLGLIRALLRERNPNYKLIK